MERRPEVTGDGGDLQCQEGQRPVLSEGDGELHPSGVHPGRRERERTGWKSMEVCPVPPVLLSCDGEGRVL